MTRKDSRATAAVATLDGPASAVTGSLARGVLLAIATVFFLCRFLHLAADYPHFVRWEDGVLSDEGWYAAGAANLHHWGLPLLSGDMNTAVLMPVWPLLAHVAFLLFGFHVEVLRGLAVVLTLVAAAMLGAVLRRYGAVRFVPLFLALLAVNPWSFVIGRAAFLEAPMLVFFLGAMLLVLPGEQDGAGAGRAMGAGLLFGLAWLTKSSAVPLAPVLLFALLQGNGYRWGRTVRDAVLLFGTAAVPLALFYGTVSRHLATDALYYTSTIPSHTGTSLYGLLAQATRPFRYAPGADHLLFAFDLLLLLASAVLPRVRRLWRDPLFALAGVWISTVLLALIALNNVMVHYLALMIPALLLLAVAVLRMPAAVVPLRWQRVFLVLLACDAAVNAVQVASFVVWPQYKFLQAAQGIDRIVQATPGANRVVLGDNAAEVGLLADIQPVSLFSHSAYVSRQVDRFRPDWWLQYLPEDDGSCYRVLLQRAYGAEERGAWTIPDGRRLVLYRLTRVAGATLPHALSAAELAACRSPYVASQREFADVPVDPRFAR